MESEFRDPETVLIVDGDLAILSLIRGILNRHGHNVLAADSFEKGLNICQSYKPIIELALVEVMMPRMTGPQFAAQARILRPYMRFLYLSGHDCNELTASGILVPGDTFLAKPFLPDVLIKNIRQVLDTQRVATAGSMIH